jgi:hypothetical protein
MATGQRRTGGSPQLEFSFSLLATWPRIREGTRGQAKFIQNIRVSLVDVRESVSIQFFVHEIRKSFAIRQFVIGDFIDCLGDATACEQRLYSPFLDNSVEKQRRLNVTQLDAKCAKRSSLAKFYTDAKQHNGR